MTSEQTIDKIALAALRGIAAGPLLECVRTVGLHDFMRMPAEDCVRITGGGQGMYKCLATRQEVLDEARAEYYFARSHGISCISILDEDYPSRLRDCDRPPLMLFKLGEADLDAARSLSAVGTRRASPYGVSQTHKIIKELQPCRPVTIVSGLAYGIDAEAHAAALETQMPTVAVVAHGLGMVYPATHRDLARCIIENRGAIVTEYLHGMKPFRGNFLERNRIVAALGDVTLVIESPLKGGAMSTAAQAYSYGRIVTALPGRVSDTASQGCNALIASGRAEIFTSVGELIRQAGWEQQEQNALPKQGNLFEALDGDARRVAEFLAGNTDPVHMDTLVSHTGIPVSQLMAVIGEMEFDGLVVRYPGNRFTIL